jgi:hypothetical protein
VCAACLSGSVSVLSTQLYIKKISTSLVHAKDVQLNKLIPLYLKYLYSYNFWPLPGFIVSASTLKLFQKRVPVKIFAPKTWEEQNKEN